MWASGADAGDKDAVSVRVDDTLTRFCLRKVGREASLCGCVCSHSLSLRG